jgi:hypothetical protein
MQYRYIPATGVKEDSGAATFHKGRLSVIAPIAKNGIIRNRIIDHSKLTGYEHSYLRPYEVFVRGFWRGGEKKAVPYTSIITICYILVEGAYPIGLRCVGAISLTRVKTGYTFVFFPVLPRQKLENREIDHLSAHIAFEDGLVKIDNVHGKARLENEKYPTENIKMENLKSDEYHFAFEYWFKKADLLDRAGLVTTGGDPLNSRRSDSIRIKSCIDNSQPRVFGCSIPTTDGLFPLRVPGFLRVGILTEKGRQTRGGTASALSSPWASKRKSHISRVHRYREISLIDRNWPAQVSLFMEIGILKTKPRRDHTLPDIKATTFEQFKNV